MPPPCRPDSGRQQTGIPSARVSKWREQFEELVAASEMFDVRPAISALAEEVHVVLEETGELTGRDREAAKKLHRKLCKAALEAKKQKYAWAVVVDLEGKPPNIIEFPAIVIDTTTGCERGRFHRWVRADQGDNQNNLQSNAVPFPAAFADFQGFLDALNVDEEEAILVCCGDFDARALRRMLDHHRMPRPAFLQRWVNLKDAVFNREHARLKPADPTELATSLDGMNKLADYLEVPGIHEGVGMELHHLGMHDTTKIAMTLVFLIVQQGLVLRATTWTSAGSLKGALHVRDFSARER